MDAEVNSFGGYLRYSYGTNFDCGSFHNGPGCAVHFIAGDPPYIVCDSCKVACSIEAVAERIQPGDARRPATPHPPTTP